MKELRGRKREWVRFLIPNAEVRGRIEEYLWARHPDNLTDWEGPLVLALAEPHRRTRDWLVSLGAQLIAKEDG